jgi:GrpB-like predicted nucleotidyltransferase (UPF0157 family)
MVSITLAEYDPSWPLRYQQVAAEMATALPVTPATIDHIGSTSVPGLAAKPAIDVMVTVDDVAATHEAVHGALTRLGYRWHPDNADARKRFYKRTTPFAVHVHVRRRDCFSASAALLLRDFLRATPAARDAYLATKRRLAARGDVWTDGDEYAEAKGDTVWQLLREADRWAWSGAQPTR